MDLLYLVLGLVVFALGVVVAIRPNVEPRLRLFAGLLAAGGMIILLYLWLWSPSSRSREYRQAVNRQGYVLGFGLGQFLKQTQPGHNVAVLRWKHSPSARNTEAIAGLKDGLAGALKVVTEREVALVRPSEYQTAAADFTPALLADLKSAGAEIVVSFVGLPVKTDITDALDNQATLEIWRSPEYSALQWVLTDPPQPKPPGLFREGRVLVFAREKLEPIAAANGMPAHLQSNGTPAELFNAWFELITSDADHP